MKTIKECRVLKQAKEIFNNTAQDIDEHLVEELKELIEAVMNGDAQNVEDESGDVLYMLIQKFDLMDIDINMVIDFAISKNEKKRV